MKPRSSDRVANKRTPGSVTNCIGRRIKNHPNDSDFSLCLDLLRNFFLISKIIKPVYLDVIAVGAVNVENDAALVASSWTVAADHAFAKSDALVGHDKLVENVFAVSDAVFDDALLQRMATSDKTVEDGHAVSQTGTAYRDLTRVDTVLDRSFQNGQTDVLIRRISGQIQSGN